MIVQTFYDYAIGDMVMLDMVYNRVWKEEKGISIYDMSIKSDYPLLLFEQCSVTYPTNF